VNRKNSSSSKRSSRSNGSARNGRSASGSRKTRSSGSSNGSRKRDALSLLRADHDTVRELLSQLEGTTARGARKREQLLQSIAQEVRVHAAIEEEIFYPAYREAARKEEDLKLFFEATEEHALVDIVLPALEETDPSSEEFGAKAKVLKDLIEHHAEEEETEMFPRAKRLLGSELESLGEQLEARKQDLMRSGGARDDSMRESVVAGAGRVRR
jgi:hemerythrin-like domain-containing protein